MINYKDKISATLESNTDDLISFVQEIVRTPSLANEERDVQEIFHNKLISLDMESRILPVNLTILSTILLLMTMVFHPIRELMSLLYGMDLALANL